MVEQPQEHHHKSRYDKLYKILILIPLLFTIVCAVYMVNFYKTNHDFIHKDISLKGGTSITIYTQTDIKNLSTYLSNEFSDFTIREISDLRTGKQEAIMIEVSDSPEIIKASLEKYLNTTLDNSNSSIEFTGSSIGTGFYKQALFSILLSFSLMGMVIFLIFAKGLKLKFLVILLATLPLILFMSGISIDTLFYFLIVDLIICGIIYFRFNMPSFFVILCAFIDIFMTLSIINFLGIKVSTAGIIALLMLIGYSVDSDILLTSRVLRSQEGTVNERIKSAFKTGMTMTMTTFAAVVICLIVTQNFSPALKQIFTILTIGLVLDVINTWITNASLIKYYMERGLHKNN
jgi:preprotein translocase subunit SecF